MNRRFIEIISISVLLFISYALACYAKNYSEIEEKIYKGQSKQSIIELLGEPLKKTNIVKRNKFIWGPEEEFCDEIPMGTRLEVWKYEFPDGHLNLYFTNGGKYLDYNSFTPKGVVY